MLKSTTHVLSLQHVISLQHMCLAKTDFTVFFNILYY